MTADQFWDGDPWLAAAYRRANELSKQRLSEQLWLQGLYNFNAMSTALSNLNFSGKRKKLNHYLEEPIRLIPLTEEEKAAKAEEERQKTIAYFNRLAKQWEAK